MAVYEYEHEEEPCGLGKVFEITQSIKDEPMTQCPECKTPVKRIISITNINTPKTNSELKDMGFTKLVKKDTGVYENVTAREGDNKIVYRDKPETMPNLKKTISD
jgi:putative FmdB family regulatory protein